MIVSGVPTVRLSHADCRAFMRQLRDEGVVVHSIVTDPPYELGFMGRSYDSSGVSFDPEMWRAAYDLLPPGGHLLSFGGTRTYHRMACAIEDAGFEIRDQIMWLYATGFPKSHNLHGDWEGWGTSLKPAHEPIVLARKPLAGTVSQSVLAHGTGAINVDGCRVPSAEVLSRNNGARGNSIYNDGDWRAGTFGTGDAAGGRWPANIVHDSSGEVEQAFAAFGAGKSRSGTASRFFYSAKAGRLDRVSQCLGCGLRAFGKPQCSCDGGTKARSHETTKPLDLMRWMVRIVTPPGGLVLDPFMGSGTTMAAALAEGFSAIGCDLKAEHHGDAVFRCANLPEDRKPAAKARAKPKTQAQPPEPDRATQLLLGFSEFLKARDAA